MSNIVGINLDVDNNYLTEAVKQTVMVGIAECLDKDKIVSGLVNTVLETKVDRDGKVSSYNSDNKYTLLEVYVNKILRESVKEELANLVEEKKPQLKELIRKELNKKATLDKFVDSFLQANLDNLSNDWRTTINLEYKKTKEY